jgi:hypothetical protein
MSRETTPSWRSRSASPSTSLPTPWPQAPWPTGCPIPPPGCSPGSLERWVNWRDHGGDVETVVSKDDLCTHATIYWVTNTIGTSIRTYANKHRYPRDPVPRPPAPHRGPPCGIAFVGYENPPGVRTDQRVQHFRRGHPASPAADTQPAMRNREDHGSNHGRPGAPQDLVPAHLAGGGAAAGHLLDHLIRGNAVGWPLTDQVNAFTISLVWVFRLPGGIGAAFPGQLDRALLEDAELSPPKPTRFRRCSRSRAATPSTAAATSPASC